MARPYSLDLRERVVARVAAGDTVRAIAEVFGVGVSNVVKWSQRKRSTGSAAAKPMGGWRGPLVLAGSESGSWPALPPEPDLTLRALLAELAGRGVKVSYGALWSFVAREGLSFKKSLHASEQDRPDVARRRERWKRHQRLLDPRRLIFIDETWAKTNMTRTHGRSPRGRRLVAKVPHGRWRTLTFLAALRCDKITAPCVFDGPSTANVSRLCRTAARSDALARRHRDHGQPRQSQGQAVRRAIRAAGAKLFFLPLTVPISIHRAGLRQA